MGDDRGCQIHDALGRCTARPKTICARAAPVRAGARSQGGLKIHTIHGFCERLLQRFPLESQVTPHFSVLNEREQLLLRRAAFDATVTRAAKHGDSVLGKALTKIVGLTSGDYIRQVIDTVLGKHAELARMVAYHGSGADWFEAECQALKRLFGVAEQAEDALIEQLADVPGITTRCQILQNSPRVRGTTTRKPPSARRAPAPAKGVLRR
jgi:ATP-dependent helicase/nuclease subunit A